MGKGCQHPTMTIKRCVQAGNVAQSVECLPSMHQTLGLIPSTIINPGKAAWFPTLGVQAGESEGYPEP